MFRDRFGLDRGVCSVTAELEAGYVQFEAVERVPNTRGYRPLGRSRSNGRMAGNNGSTATTRVSSWGPTVAPLAQPAVCCRWRQGGV